MVTEPQPRVNGKSVPFAQIEEIKWIFETFVRIQGEAPETEAAKAFFLKGLESL